MVQAVTSLNECEQKNKNVDTFNNQNYKKALEDIGHMKYGQLEDLYVCYK